MMSSLNSMHSNFGIYYIRLAIMTKHFFYVIVIKLIFELSSVCGMNFKRAVIS